MNEQQALNYVHASAELLGVPLDAARAQRVAGHLQRTAALAAMLQAVDLSVEDEPAELYCPSRPAPGEGAS
jgi:hypothetical protein